ncbi:MAG: protein kinase domain-containing protein [Gemmataceae bacterium]
MNEPHDPNVTADADSPCAGDPHRTTDHVRSSSDTEPSHPPADAPAADLPAVPGYRVLREIARGGMGRVLAAFDLTLDRDVALKVLLSGANADRFVRESRITARLPHPAIPPVHALGTLADGCPFLAMKLVVGQTLAVEMKSADRPRLLQAFTQVCQAVGFAHSRGVIHRDLKPANVMVGAFGEVQVMDWGLAKELTGREVGDEPRSAAPPALPAAADAGEVTGHHSAGESTDDQTQAGTVLGTPVYMAPEVATGQAATTAADVYGLGAILYTLLAGRPPYTGTTAADVLKKVTTTDPSLFAQANSSVPPALVAICRKAMARDPDDRYPSADDVATDVRRWLTDEPVSVYREPWTGRVARWARGRKTTVVAAAVLLLTTAVAATATAGLVWREQRQTKFQRERAEGEKVNATENAAAAITVVRDLSSYIRLVELAGGRQSVTDQQRKFALDHALPGYERLLALHPDDEQLRSTLALTHRFRANLCRVLGETGEAEKSYREASRHYGELVAGKPEVSNYQFDLALTGRDFALLLKTLGRLKESTEILEVSIRHLDQKWRADPKNPESQQTLAMMLLDRAELDFALGRFADAERHARRSMELYAQSADAAAASPEKLAPLFHGMAELRLAMALRELGRLDDALAVHDQALGRLAGFMKLQNESARSYTFEYHRAQAERGWTSARMSNRHATGLADLDSAVAGFEKLAKQFPQFPAYLRSQGMGTLYRGRLKAIMGRPEAAGQDLNAAVKIFENLVAKFPDVPVYRSFLGQSYIALGQLDRDPMTATRWYRQAREMLDGAVQRSPENAQDRKALADLDALAGVPRP